VVKFGPSEATVQIIGVVGNVRHITLERSAARDLFAGLASAMAFDVCRRPHAGPDPVTMLNTSPECGLERRQNIPLANVRTMGDVIAQSVGRQKFTMLLLTIFAGVAMLDFLML
jgi:hypothetical protein